MDPKPGELFTIEKWNDSKDRSWCGDVLRCIAINVEHYIVAETLTGFLRNSPFSLDRRRVTLMPVSYEYVAALVKDPVSLKSIESLIPKGELQQ